MRWVLLLTAGLVACGSDEPVPTDPVDTDVDTDTEDPFEPGPDLPAGVAGAFALVDEAETRTDIVWSAADDNLVFCRLYGSEAWIRLAEQIDADGENGPHVDIDVCGWDGSGSYAPRTTDEGGCTADKAFDISWQSGASVWASDGTATDCTLELTTSGETVEGRFSCRGIVGKTQAEGAIDLRNGQFRCTPVDG